jgi:MFS family permease
MGPRVLRITLTAFITDFSLYLIWTAIPFKAISLGATPAVLGLLPAMSSSVYVLTTLYSGRLSDRVSRLRLARAGALGFALGCILLWRAGSIAAILPSIPLVGLAMGLFWPPIQAAVADEGRPEKLERNIGLFNMLWSSGKAMGFLVGGILFARFGGGVIFLGAAVVMGVMTFVLPRRPAGGASDAGPVGGAYERVSPRDLRAFLWMAWVANAVAFGVGHTMNTQYPKLLVENGFDSRDFGVYLFLIFVMQTLTFMVLRNFGGWRFRRLPAYSVQAAMGLAVVLVSFTRAFPLILVSAVPLGIGLGLAYHASITYSLASRSGRGQRAGIHEALLGAGNLTIPLVGGLLASSLGDLRVPYWFAGGVLVAGLVAQEVLWRRMPAPRAEAGGTS